MEKEAWLGFVEAMSSENDVNLLVATAEHMQKASEGFPLSPPQPC